MNARPRSTMYGEIAKTYVVMGKGVFLNGIESATLLSRLLLFDQVIVRSIRLQEIPFLVKLFGMDGLKQLLSERILQISAEASSPMLDRHFNGKRELPLLHFQQGYIDVPDHTRYLSDCASCFGQISGLSNSGRDDLAKLVMGEIVRPQPSYCNDLGRQIQIDIASNDTLLKRLLSSDKMKLGISEESILLKVEMVSTEIERFETNLGTLLGVSKEKEHKILDDLIKAVVNLNIRIADMAAYSAISSFETFESPYLFGKIHGVASRFNPSFDENAFLRVLKFTGIPDLLITGRIDVQKLLSVRDSDECRAFRSWLPNTESTDDPKLEKLVSGLRSRLSAFISSPKGKTIRLAANSALGLIPGYGTAISIAEGVADSFLLDRLLPSPGALSFLINSMPSIFEKAYEI